MPLSPQGCSGLRRPVAWPARTTRSRRCRSCVQERACGSWRNALTDTIMKTPLASTPTVVRLRPGSRAAPRMPTRPSVVAARLVRAIAASSVWLNATPEISSRLPAPKKTPGSRADPEVMVNTSAPSRLNTPTAAMSLTRESASGAISRSAPLASNCAAGRRAWPRAASHIAAIAANAPARTPINNVEGWT